MATTKITKRTVEAAEPRATRYAIYDSEIHGFGLRVYPSGQKSWIYDYRPAPGGQSTPMKRNTIGLAASADGKTAPDFTADAARKRALQLQSLVVNGGDPQGEKTAKREAETVADLADAFLKKHVEPKRKPGTAWHYRDILDRIVIPDLGSVRAAELQRRQVSKLHLKIGENTPFQANRVLAVLSSMYVWAAGEGYVPEGFNPAMGVGKFEENARGAQLDPTQLERLGAAIREAETVGIPWDLEDGKDHKRLRKTDRVTRIGTHAAAALRLLIFTGARLREILHLRWDQVDLDRGLLLLPVHKTSRTKGSKTIILNAPALRVLQDLPRIGVYVIASESAGQKFEKPRADLKKPWAMVRDRAELAGIRLHDLRHNYASFGVSGGMGLPLVGKLLGHAQASTTQRYAHLHDDPLRKAANTIGADLAAAMGETMNEPKDNVVALSKAKSGR